MLRKGQPISDATEDELRGHIRDVIVEQINAESLPSDSSSKENNKNGPVKVHALGPMRTTVRPLLPTLCRLLKGTGERIVQTVQVITAVPPTR